MPTHQTHLEPQPTERGPDHTWTAATMLLRLEVSSNNSGFERTENLPVSFPAISDQIQTSRNFGAFRFGISRVDQASLVINSDQF
jgi:hypothetical protein